MFYSAIPSELKHQFQNRSENRGERTFIMLECIIRCDACVVIVIKRFSDQLFSVNILLILMQSMFELMFR